MRPELPGRPTILEPVLVIRIDVQVRVVERPPVQFRLGVDRTPVVARPMIPFGRSRVIFVNVAPPSIERYTPLPDPPLMWEYGARRKAGVHDGRFRRIRIQIRTAGVQIDIQHLFARCAPHPLFGERRVPVGARLWTA